MVLFSKFKTDENYCLYDTYSNRIFLLNKEIYDNLEKYIKSYETGVKPTVIGDETFKEFYDFVTKNDILKDIDYPFSEDSDTEKKILEERSRLTLDLTYECNCRCDYCIYSGKYSTFRTHQNISMPFEIGRKAIDDFFNHSKKSPIKSISFYGGESLKKYRTLKRLIRYAKRIYGDFLFSINTNGLLLKEPYIKWLAENNIGIQLSLDGPKEIHDRYRKDINGNGTFDRIIRNLKYIAEKYPDYLNSKFSINVTISPPFYLKKIYNWFNNEFKEIISNSNLVINVVPILQKNINLRKYWEINADDLEKDLNDVKNSFLSNVCLDNINPIEMSFCSLSVVKPISGIHDRNLMKLKDGIKLVVFGCIPGHAKTFVSPEGIYYPCERVNNAFPIGNVEKGIDIGLVHELQQRYIEYLSPCKTCWAKRLCNTCLSTIEEYKEFSPVYFERECNSIRKNILNQLYIYCTIMEKNPIFFERIVTLEKYKVMIK